MGTRIKTDAKGDTLEKGKDLKIVCEAHSKPNPIFDLYHRLGRQVVKVRNSTTGEFYIRNIKASQRGNYSCVPHNDVGEGEVAMVPVYVRCKKKLLGIIQTCLKLKVLTQIGHTITKLQVLNC